MERPASLSLVRLRSVYYGWWIVAAWVVLNIYWAGTLLYGLTVFFTPVRQAFGWNATLMASIFSLANVLTGLLSPVTGAWFDRAGPRPLMLVAGGCGALGLIALGRTTSLPLFTAAFALVSIGYSIWSGLGMATAGLWFIRRRGLAMGVIVAGSSLGGLLVPVWQAVVQAAGWRTGFTLAGIGMLVVGLSASLVLRHRPSELGLSPDGDRRRPVSAGEASLADPVRSKPAGGADGQAGLRAALRTWQFWAVSGMAAAILAGSTAATVLVLPRLQEAGVRANLAVAAATLAILLGAVGRPACGIVADRGAGRGSIPRLAAATFALQAVGLFALAIAPQHLVLLLVFILAFGLTNDSVRMLASLLLLRYFGPRAIGRILGMHFLILIPGRVLGPVVAGALHDGGYGYGDAFVLLAVISLLMIVPAMLLRPPAAATGV